jgi:hypothetical protein
LALVALTAVAAGWTMGKTSGVAPSTIFEVFSNGGAAITSGEPMTCGEPSANASGTGSIDWTVNISTDGSGL